MIKSTWQSQISNNFEKNYFTEISIFVVLTKVKSQLQRLAMHELPSAELIPPLPPSCTPAEYLVTITHKFHNCMPVAKLE